METDIRLAFGNNLKKYRLKKKMTQEALAELTGIDYKYIQKLEGKNPPAVKIDTIKRIAAVFKIPSSKLLESNSK